MGRQQSFVKFESKEELINQLKRYEQRETKQDQTYVIGVVKVIKPVSPFVKDELALVLGGESYGQRNPLNLKEETGIENALHTVAIDCERFWMMAKGDLGTFLDKHFLSLNEEEYLSLINNNSTMRV